MFTGLDTIGTKIIAVLLLIGTLFAIGFGTGYHIADKKYINFKAEVESAAKIQQLKAEEDRKYDEQITNDVVTRYRNALASMQHSSTSGVYSIPKTTRGVNEDPSYATLVDECRQTTLQLDYLQEWVNEQFKEDQHGN